jgi:hypothetical protein
MIIAPEKIGMPSRTAMPRCMPVRMARTTYFNLPNSVNGKATCTRTVR